MNKKKILAELVGYLVRKEFTVYEVLDAYYEESERHFFEDDLPETIPSEEQKNPYKLEPLPCRFEGQRELTQDEINQAVADVNRIYENKALQINAEKEPAETLETLETLETEPETTETPAETKVTEPETKGTVINGDYTLKDVHKMYRGTFYENVKDFILDGKTIDEHLKENNILPVRFYDRMNSKGWTVRKAATTPINSKYDYDQIMPNGKTILQNLNRLGLGKSTFCYRVRRGYSLYEACTISEYDMRSKQTTKGVRAWKKSMEEKLKAENEQEPDKTEQEPDKEADKKLQEPKPADKLIGKDYNTVIIDTVPAEEREPKQEPKKGSKKEPKQEPKREYTFDDPPAKNVVASSVPDLTLVDICQNMKISMKRLKDRIDKGTFPKPDKGNKWSYAAVRFYFPNWG